MRSLVACAVLCLGALSLASIGCQAPDDDTLAGELSEEEAPDLDEQTPVIGPLCPDLEIIELKIVFCGYQEGPMDTSPIQVTCTRDCLLDRQMAFTPSGSTCTTVSKTCDAWDCPSCD